MPFQVNGQFVTTKSSKLVHVGGWDGAFALTAGGAFVATMSSADAWVAHAAIKSIPVIAVPQAMRAIAPSVVLALRLRIRVVELSHQLRPQSSSTRHSRKVPQHVTSPSTAAEGLIFHHPTRRCKAYPTPVPQAFVRTRGSQGGPGLHRSPTTFPREDEADRSVPRYG